MLKAPLLVAALALWAGAVSATEPAPKAREIVLDLPADFAPVWCSDRLYLFASEGRNQSLGPGDEAPNCNPLPLSPAIQPSCGAEGVLVLDRDGNLWRIGQGFPATIQGGFKGALALWQLPAGVAVLFEERMVISGLEAAPLPFKATAAEPLASGGFWARGDRQAARLDPSGRVLWTWTPRRGSPGPATLSGATLFAGTSRGELVALEDAKGRVRYRYRGGGEVLSPPRADGGKVIWASSDHFIRCVDGRSGTLLWQFRASGRPAFGPFPVEAGLLFAEAAGSRLFVLAPEDGRKLWDWKAPQGSILRSPAIGADRAAVLLWSEEANPTLYLVPLPPKGQKAAVK